MSLEIYLVLGSIILQLWHPVQSHDFPQRPRRLRVKTISTLTFGWGFGGQVQCRVGFGGVGKKCHRDHESDNEHESHPPDPRASSGQGSVSVVPSLFPALPSLSVEKWSDWTRWMARGTKFHCSAALTIYAMWKNHSLSLSLLPSPIKWGTTPTEPNGHRQNTYTE